MKKFDRLLNPDIIPTSRSIQDILGKRNFTVWEEINNYLNNSYEIKPEIIFYGKKYGWCYKYKKSSKTLCSLFPEKGSFTVLITLGRNELEKLKPDLSNLSLETQETINKAHQYHDGKWLWLRLPIMSNIKDVKSLLNIKRKLKPTK